MKVINWLLLMSVSDVKRSWKAFPKKKCFDHVLRIETKCSFAVDRWNLKGIDSKPVTTLIESWKFLSNEVFKSLILFRWNLVLIAAEKRLKERRCSADITRQYADGLRSLWFAASLGGYCLLWTIRHRHSMSCYVHTLEMKKLQ
jgi:hypothetical protein